MDSHDQEHMSFTNLLSQDSQSNLTHDELNESSPVIIGDSPTLPSNNPNNTRKPIRGVNFSLEEDKLLVSAWLNCSLDAIQGTDQKHFQYWEKISAYFHQHKVTTTERTVKSLIHRWSAIQKATNKFCAKLAQVDGLNQSGMTEQDKIDKAKTMYSKLEKCNFQFEHCWQLLKNQPKWILHATKDNAKQRKTKSPSLTIDSVFDLETGNMIKNDITELERPTGTKAEKGKRKAQGKQAEENFEIRKMKYTLLEESRAQEKEYYRLKAEKMEHDKEMEEKRLRLEVEKIEISRRESDQRIMMMDLNVMSEMQRLYFLELQREIVMRCGRDNQLDG